MRKTLNELIKKGYAYRWQPKNEKGQYSDWEVVIFEEQKSEYEIKKMFPQLPSTLKLAQDTDSI